MSAASTSKMSGDKPFGAPPSAVDNFLFFKPRKSSGPVPSTLGKRQIRTIIEAIHTCWAELSTFDYQKSKPFQVSHLTNEDELTTKLVEILNYKLQRNLIKGFKSNLFQDVHRDAKQTTADAESYDQMPDMSFRMIRFSDDEDRTESGLFVECKLVSKASGCGQYVIAGMHRFVSGRYAPQMGYGLMLGYAKPDFNDPASALAEYFKAASKPESVQCKADLTPTKLHDSCFASEHERALPCATQFCIFHTWVVRPGDDALPA